ncbi:MAG: hypothetical protein RSC43_08385, partial [Clostridia bacterium]
MNIDKTGFTIYPSVVVAGRDTSVCITPNGSHARFDDNFKSLPIDILMTPRLPAGYSKINNDVSYTIYIIPMEHTNFAAPIESYDHVSVRPCDGCLAFNYVFSDEQEYELVIMDPFEDGNELTVLNMYCINADLCGKLPFKGDLHIHSYYSDGQEAPEIVAANYRAHGFDFMAITDHCRRFPSEFLIDFYRNIPIDLAMYYGEEVHVPYPINIHAVCVGASCSVNEYYVDNKEKCDAECAQLAEKLTLPKEFDAVDIAKHMWIAAEIKKRGGLAILVHPHWIYQHVYHMRDSSVQYLLRNNIYDAFEVLGGSPIPLNNLQTALYSQMRAEGATIPVVGNSDSHGTEPPVYFNETFTVAFSSDTTFERISSAIKNLDSVAVQNPPNGPFEIFGEYR